MRSPVDIVMGRVGGFPIREITRRTVPCYKYVVEDGREALSVCLLIDGRYLYKYPFDQKKVASLATKAAYLRGEMEHLKSLLEEARATRDELQAGIESVLAALRAEK